MEKVPKPTYMEKYRNDPEFREKHLERQRPAGTGAAELEGSGPENLRHLWLCAAAGRDSQGKMGAGIWRRRRWGKQGASTESGGRQ